MSNLSSQRELVLFFCDNITLAYASSFDEINVIHLNNKNHIEMGNNVLLMPLSIFELKNIISTRSSPYSGLDKLFSFIHTFLRLA